MRDVFGAEVGIGWEHHQVHEGRMFAVSDEDDNVDIVTPKEWLFITGAGSDVHLAFQVGCSAGFKVELYEGATASNDGTGLSVVAMNRQDVKTIGLTAFKGPTITGDGTNLATARAGGSNPSAKGAFTARPGLEWELKASTKYLVRVTVVADNTTATMDAAAYEPSAA